MLYPGNAKKDYHKVIPHANRGMSLEFLINEANDYYMQNDIAVIYKKPTPITISNVAYPNNKKVVTKGLFKSKSTLDYVGVYKGKYLDFDAKCSLNKSSYPLSNIHNHQINHIRKIIKNMGISFLIININSCYYILKGEDLITFIDNNSRKSIPMEYIQTNGYEIKLSYLPCLNYLDILNKIYFEKVK